MRLPTRADLQALLAERQGPCVSIYLPTNRDYPSEQQGPARYKNAVRAAEELLAQKFEGADLRGPLEKYRALMDDQYFWSHRLDGLAIFGARDLFQIFDLQTRPKEVTIVADRFHVKPLLRYTQSADRFQVLCLQRERCWMLEGDRYALDPIDLRGVPGTIREALGDEIVVGSQIVAAHGPGTGGSHHAPGKPTVPHGHAAEGDDSKRDTERFFREVDKAVWETHSRPSNLPLVLAALPQHQSLFREHSKNQHLLPDGIVGNPASMDGGKLVEAAWKAFEPQYLKRLEKFTEDFGTARARRMGSDDITVVAAAACDGRVGILLVDADKQVPGTLDRATGRWQPGDFNSPGVDDVLDDLAENVVRTKGTVVVVPPERMPTQTGVAAIFRY